MKRFWDKVDTVGKCWKWLGAITSDGYGSFWLDGKVVYSHRFAYSLVYGDIPEGMCICHHCDNPGCVRPSHLFVGTLSDNSQDSVAKGRDNPPQGEINGRSRLVENDVHEIRRLYSVGVAQSLLAKMWSVSRRHIRRIVRRQRWGHI